MSDRGSRRRRAALGLALLLIGAGLVAIVYGAGLFRPQAPPSVQAPSPTPEPLIPTATAGVAGATAGHTATAQQPMPTETGQVGQSSTNEEVTFSPSPSTTRGPTPLAQTLTPTGAAEKQPTPMPTPSQTPAHPTVTPTLAALPETQPTLTPKPSQPMGQGLLSLRQRAGVVAPLVDIERYSVAPLGAGWYVTGLTELEPLKPGGMDFAQLVQVLGAEHQPSPERLQEIARRNPGALWLVGNEPDVIWQDNASPPEYAQVYHKVHSAVKGVDPEAQMAIGGIAQVTPLRLRYLEAVLAAYQERYGQPMPVDVWNIHLAILREERGSWGVDIPPGLPDETGVLYEIQDNANIEILKEQVLTFRRWMADHGLRDKPLVVTEFSVLMPSDYGFPVERVRTYMLAAFDFFVSATDDRFGYPADENRLVQRWAWYSVADRIYSTGNLFDPETTKITPLGRSFAEYMAGR